MQPNVARVMVEALSAWGVQNIFGVTGNAVLPLLDALGKQDQIKYYGTVSEQGAAFMAAGEARITGKPGVCLATEGPGALNLANGVADAYRDGVPLLVITGQVQTAQINTNAKQYLDLQCFFAPITGFTTQLTRPESVLPTLQAAMEKAIGDGIPCHLSVPRDIFQSPAPAGQQIPPLTPPNPPAILGNVEEFCRLLQDSQKPIIVTGRASLPYREKVLALSQKIGAGIIPGLGARGIYPGDLEQNLGGLGEAHMTPLLSRADAVFLVGASPYEEKFVPHSTMVSLLQIEAKPQKLMSAPGLWSLTGDISLILDTLLEKIPASNNTPWRKQVRQCHRDFVAMISSETDLTDLPISPRAVVAALNEAMAPDAVIALDTGEFMQWLNRGLMARHQEVLVSEKWRCMGGGLPTGLGAKAACPKRQVLVLAGDGGLMMSIMEIGTAVRYSLPLVVLVFNNGCYLLEKHRMEKNNMYPLGVDLIQPDLVSLAQSLGAQGLRVENPSQLIPVLNKALSGNKTVLVDIITNREKPSYI